MGAAERGNAPDPKPQRHSPDGEAAMVKSEPSEQSRGSAVDGSDPETPEADAIEQRQEILLEFDDEPLESLPADASEADALDQARSVPFDDDRYPDDVAEDAGA